MWIKNVSPCDRECPKRTTTCHGTCERYVTYAEGQKAKRKARQQSSIWTPGKDITRGKAKPPAQKNMRHGDFM